MSRRLKADRIVCAVEYASEYGVTYIARHDAKCCEELPKHDQRTSELGGSAFRCIDWDGSTFQSDSYPQQESEADHHAPILREGL